MPRKAKALIALGFSAGRPDFGQGTVAIARCLRPAVSFESCPALCHGCPVADLNWITLGTSPAITVARGRGGPVFTGQRLSRTEMRRSAVEPNRLLLQMLLQARHQLGEVAGAEPDVELPTPGILPALPTGTGGTGGSEEIGATGATPRGPALTVV